MTSNRRRSEYLLSQAMTIVNAGAEEGLALRLLGGLAVYQKCRSFREQLGAEREPISDIDLLISPRALRPALPLLARLGFEEDLEWRTTFGHERRVFYSPENVTVDLFLDPLRFCQDLAVGERLTLDSPTLDVTVLFLSRIQRVDLRQTDVLDLGALLGHISSSDSETDRMDRRFVAELAARSWRWWKALTVGLEELNRRLPAPLADEKITAELRELERQVDEVPKTLGWRFRAMFGTGLPWCREVEFRG